MKMEKLRSVILFALFGVCIVLTGQLLYDFRGFGTNVSESLKSEQIHYENILIPQSCQVSFGGGLYTGFFSQEYQSGLWDETKNYLKNYIQYLDLDPIDQEVWNSAVEEKSVLFVMPTSLTVEQVGMILNPEEKSSGVNISLDQIIIPGNDDRSLYIGSDSERKYYRLTGVVRGAFVRNMIEKVAEAPETVKAQRMDDLYSLRKLLEVPGKPFKENNVLVPNSNLKGINFIKVSSEISPTTITENQLKGYINKAFGNRNDFVKKVEDLDGSVVYIYGYGDKALKIGIDGSIEYKARIERRFSGKVSTFVEGLGLALKSIDLYGPRPEGLYLTGFSEEKTAEGDVVKRYTFNFTTQTLPMYLSGKTLREPIEVEITNSEVSLVKRNIKRFARDYSFSEWDETMEIIDLLQLNYTPISDRFEKYDFKGQAKEDFNRFRFELIQNIHSMKLCYFYDEKLSRDNLVPCWKMKVGSTTYLINVYSGEMMFIQEPDLGGGQ